MRKWIKDMKEQFYNKGNTNSSQTVYQLNTKMIFNLIYDKESSR